MKKFLLAAAAIAAGVTMADPITSANVVGYAQGSLCNGATMVSSQFIGVGVEDGAIDLQSVKAIGEGCSDCVFASKLDSLGVVAETYTWIDWDGECWVDSDSVKAEGVTINPGEGLWVSAISSDQALQTSGQVLCDDIEVQLQNGVIALGNSTPVAIDLQDIVCSGEGCSDCVFISKIDSLGVVSETYTWIDWDGECWVDSDSVKAEGVTINPGEGLWVSAVSSNQYLTFPGVEL